MLPSVYFYVMYQRAVSHLIEVSDDEFLLEQSKPKLDTVVKYDDYDEQGLLVYILGMILLVICIILGVVVLFKQSLVGFLVWLPVFVLEIMMMYVPYQTAKYYRDIRLDLIDDRMDKLENRQIVIQRIVIGVLFLALGILVLFEWNVELVVFFGSMVAGLVMLIKNLW